MEVDNYKDLELGWSLPLLGGEIQLRPSITFPLHQQRGQVRSTITWPLTRQGNEHSQETLPRDSDLVAQKVSGTWDSRHPMIAAYRREVSWKTGFLIEYHVEHIERKL